MVRFEGLRMSSRWSIIFLVWAIPIASTLACLYDLHGASNCSAASQLGQTIGPFLSLIVKDNAYGGESFAAYAVSAVSWLVLLSAMVIVIPGWLRRTFSRP